METHFEPDEAAMAAFDACDQNAPIVCVNLLGFREQAGYVEGDAEFGTDAADVTGAQAYGRYGEVAQQTIAAVGGRLLMGSGVEQMLIGPEAAAWHVVAIVFYPSRAAFRSMIERADYQAVTHHRLAGLANTRLIVLDGRPFVEA